MEDSALCHIGRFLLLPAVGIPLGALLLSSVPIYFQSQAGEAAKVRGRYAGEQVVEDVREKAAHVAKSVLKHEGICMKPYSGRRYPFIVTDKPTILQALYHLAQSHMNRSQVLATILVYTLRTLGVAFLIASAPSLPLLGMILGAVIVTDVAYSVSSLRGNARQENHAYLENGIRRSLGYREIENPRALEAALDKAYEDAFRAAYEEGLRNACERTGSEDELSTKPLLFNQSTRQRRGASLIALLSLQESEKPEWALSTSL